MTERPPGDGGQSADGSTGGDDAGAEVSRLEDELASERERREALENAVDRLTRTIREHASGQLTTEVGRAPSQRADDLYDAYGELADEYRGTLDRMSSFGQQVSSATDRVEDRLETVKDASREVNDSVEEISSGAHEQNDHLQDVSDEMRSLSATIEEIAASADDAARTSAEASERGTSAEEAASDAMDELDSLRAHASETAEKVERLNELLTEIEDVVEFVSDIADQTNILALNANIEAARTGESGDGFAVVANEVKQLAGETKEATGEIEDSIDRVHEHAEETVAEMHETQTTVETTHETVENALDELDAVVDHVGDVDTTVQEIDAATEEQARSTQDAAAMIDEVSDISDRTAEEAATAADAAQAQTNELTEVSMRVSTLTDRADSLERMLEDFEFAAASAGSDTTVEFWHAMGGEKGILLESLAREFEEEHGDVSISLTPQGSYRGTLDATLEAAGTGNGPTIAQVFEIGSTHARDSGYFQPIEELLSRSHIDSLLDPLANYYRIDGTLHSLPFNASNPILAYNREAFRQAGLDPDTPPATFDDVRAAAEAIVDQGVAPAGITFANYSWFVEQWFAEADELLVDNGNGRQGTPRAANFDGEFARSLVEWWVGMEANGVYHDPGIEARGDAKNAFHDGEAAMLIGSTSSLRSIESGADFDVGTGMLPVRDARTGVLVGGASLWVNAAASDAEKEAAAEFLTWLTEPAQQMRWHRETGYFPVHEDAIPQLRAEGWFDEHPHYATAFEQLSQTTDTMATRGAQIGPFDSVRTIIEEGIDRIDAVEGVPDGIARINDQIESELTAYAEDGR